MHVSHNHARIFIFAQKFTSFSHSTDNKIVERIEKPNVNLQLLLTRDVIRKIIGSQSISASMVALAIRFDAICKWQRVHRFAIRMTILFIMV